MVFSALFLLAALALGDVGATSISDALQTFPYSGTSVVSRRLDGTFAAVKDLVATAVEGNKLMEIFGKEKKVVGDTPSEFYEMADYAPHQNAFKTLYSHLEHLTDHDDAATDHALLLLMEKEYGMPAVSRYVSKALTANPNSNEVKRFDSAMFNRWKKEDFSLRMVVEEMTPKDFKVTKESLEDFPRAMLVRYASREGASEADAEILASAALMEHFKDKVDTKDTLNAVLPNLKAIQGLSTSDLAAVFRVKMDATATLFDQPNGFAFLLFDRLRANQDPFKTFHRVQSLYGKDGELKSFAAKFWPSTKDVDFVSKMDQFVKDVLPTTYAGKIRNFFRRIWFKLSSIFKETSTSAGRSNHKSPRSEIHADSANDLRDVSKKVSIDIDDPKSFDSINARMEYLAGHLAVYDDIDEKSKRKLEVSRTTLGDAINDLEVNKDPIEQALIKMFDSSKTVLLADRSAIDKLNAYDEALSNYKNDLQRHEDLTLERMNLFGHFTALINDNQEILKTIAKVDKAPGAGRAISDTSFVKSQDQIKFMNALDKIESDFNRVKKEYAKFQSDRLEFLDDMEKSLTPRMNSYLDYRETGYLNMPRSKVPKKMTPAPVFLRITEGEE